MEVVDGANDFCPVESCPIFGENSFSFQVEVQLAAVHVLSDQAQSIGSGERVAKGQKEGVIDSLQK